MITEAEKRVQEQIVEQRLRFQFEFNSAEISNAIKNIAREFPDLRSEDLSNLYQLNRLATNLITSPDRINALTDFSLSFGTEFEATIIVNGVPFDDFETIQNDKFQEALDSQIEQFCRSEEIRRPGFIPLEFDNITGWRTISVMTVKEITQQQVADNLFTKADLLSFNEVEEYVFTNPDKFTDESKQSLKIYRYVIIKVLNDILINSLGQILQDILLIAGSTRYSKIALDLSNNLNVDARKSLELMVNVERGVLSTAVRAGRFLGAIFPQLRQAKKV